MKKTKIHPLDWTARIIADHQENKTLHLFLKDQWFDMIAIGEKTEEYREIKKHWTDRLFKGYTRVCFHRHYSKTFLTFRLLSITKGTGKQKWGAEQGKEYYVIKFGKVLESHVDEKETTRRSKNSLRKKPVGQEG